MWPNLKYAWRRPDAMSARATVGEGEIFQTRSFFGGPARKSTREDIFHLPMAELLHAEMVPDSKPEAASNLNRSFCHMTLDNELRIGLRQTFFRVSPPA